MVRPEWPFSVSGNDRTECMMEAIEAIMTRRSTRKYKFEMPEKDMIETITGGLILGYPAAGLPDRKPLERKGNPLTWVE